MMGSKTIAIVTVTLLPLSAIFLIFCSNSPANIRLPTHIWPYGYNITIQPFLEEKGVEPLMFSGDVQIRIQSIITAKHVILHSRKLNYTSIEYWAENTPFLKRKFEKIRMDVETERIILEPSHSLNPNYVYVLHFKYTGVINKESRGVFKNELKEAHNCERWIIATQFEPNEARSAFPCFDEPQFKAAFRISIVRPKHMKSFSNTHRACSYMKNGLYVDTFKTTPIMPVYSVAFLIAPYEERANESYAILTTPEEYKLTKFGFDFGQKMLSVLGNYFNLSYYDMGVDKLYIVPMPKVNFEGMENWGLILISEKYLFNNENSTDMLAQQKTKLLLAHELSHMWFGNLVTCDWWSSVWLNEGLASYFSYFSQEMLENSGSKSSQWTELFYESIIRHSLSIDNGDLLPINAERKCVSRAYFHPIIYLKGASIIHMVRHIIGHANFQNFIREYLLINQYKTVNVNSLYNAVLKHCPIDFKKDLETFLKSYIEQAGFPLITINSSANYSSIQVKQEIFAKSPSHFMGSSAIFTVPISFTTSLESNFSNTRPAFFLSKRTDVLDLSLNSTIKWVIGNIQATWYYRVNYDEENWLRIGEALRAYNWSGIPTLNRAQIVDDIQHLFCMGKVSSSLALKVLAYLSTELSYTPWKIALKNIGTILRNSQLNKQEITKLMQNLTDKSYKNLGFEEHPSDDLPTLNNREQLVAIACKYGNPACLAKANYYYSKPNELKKLSNHLRLVVYCSIVREGAYETFSEVFDLYCNENGTENKRLVLKALGCLRNPFVIDTYFWNIMSELMPDHEKLEALESLYTESDSNAYQVYKLISLNYKVITSILGKETTVAKVISEISKYFSESFQKEDLKNIRKKIQCMAALKIIEKAIKNLNKDITCV